MRTYIHRLLNNCNVISKYRQELMGVAILCIMLFHCNVFRHGNIGVDMFILLSGVGLTFSINNGYSGYSKYIKKRLGRVLPKYLFVAMLYFIHTSDSIIDFFENLVWFNFFFRNKGGWWFIFLIIFYYIFFPYLKKCLELMPTKSLWNLAVLIFVLVLFPFCRIDMGMLHLFILRLPVMLYSVLFGYLVYNHLPLFERSHIIGIIPFLLLASVTIIFNFHQYILYLPISVALLFTLCILFDLVPFFGTVLHFLGRYTLELYLFHEYIAKRIVTYLLESKGFAVNNQLWMVATLSIILALVMSVSFSYFCGWCQRVLSASKQV